MDLGGEAALISRGGGPLRPCQDTEVGVMYVTEDPRLVRATAFPATDRSRKAAPNVPEIRRKFKKDVNCNGTELISHLESTEVSKK
jgi:hypothetical protein